MSPEAFAMRGSIMKSGKAKRRRTGRGTRTEIRKEVEKQATGTKDESSWRWTREAVDAKWKTDRDERKSRMRKRERERCSCPNRLLIYTSVLAWKDDDREKEKVRNREKERGAIFARRTRWSSMRRHHTCPKPVSLDYLTLCKIRFLLRAHPRNKRLSGRRLT